MGLLNPHLDDAAFAEVWADRLTADAAETPRPAERHLRTCAECRSKYAAFCSWLETMRLDAAAEADEIFTHERLATQQSQILRRLEAADQPARVIAFPRFSRPVTAQPVRRQRWIAAAAAAGLIAGVALGQFMELRVSSPDATTQQAVRTPAPEPGRVQPASTSTVLDESYVYPEVMPSQARVPESLQYLNAITPSARDYDPR